MSEAERIEDLRTLLMYAPGAWETRVLAAVLSLTFAATVL